VGGVTTTATTTTTTTTIALGSPELPDYITTTGFYVKVPTVCAYAGPYATERGANQAAAGRRRNGQDVTVVEVIRHPHYLGTHAWTSPDAAREASRSATTADDPAALAARMVLLGCGAWHAAWSLRMDELAANPLPDCTLCGGPINPAAGQVGAHALCNARKSHGRADFPRLDSTPTCPCSPCTAAAAAGGRR
jgi:hypothetical protein